ncbi:MAG: hypothetical protein HKN99_09995, partial [Winogradskyella sp.]|nr:hypothetical protein [Winogradskyella sp.]
MKPSNFNTLRAVLLVIALILCIQSNAQSELTAESWQEDLRYLQKTVNNDYAFLFKKVSADTFNTEVEHLYNAIPDLADHEIMVGIARLVALFKYGHTDVGFRGSKVNYHKLPINLYHFNDGVFIEGVHQSHKDILGAKLLKIEDVATDIALNKIKPVVPVENDQYFKAYGLVYLTIPEVLHAQKVIKSYSQSVTLTLEKDSKVFKYTLDAVSPDAVPTQYSFIEQKGEWLSARKQDVRPLYLKYLDKIYYYEYLPEEKAVYVRHSQIQDDPSENIPTFYAKVFDFIETHEVDKLILDVRLNGGGNNYKNKPIVTGIIKSDKINKPGHLFVIIGRRTFSACQNLINELHTYTNTIFVGEPSAENINFYGDNKRVVLPHSQIPVYLSFAWWQDKPQWENADWTIPHLAVDMSFEDYRTNQDPVLERALNFVNDGFIMNPMEHLTALFTAGQYEQLQDVVMKMVNDSRYEFIDFEDQFNRVAYNMIGGDRNQGAIIILDLTTKAFPKSITAWYNL